MDIEVKNLSKTFGDKKVLNNINITFGESKLTCIMGQSGCGKTTLLNVIMGLIRADKGEIKGVGNKGFAAVFQEERLCEGFTAVANIKLVCGRDKSLKNIEEHLREVWLEDVGDKPVSQLSGGMRRRVAIVRAVIAESDIIIMDEPFKGLDEKIKIQVMEYVKKYTSEKTVIITTHNSYEVKMLKATLIEM